MPDGVSHSSVSKQFKVSQCFLCSEIESYRTGLTLLTSYSFPSVIQGPKDYYSHSLDYNPAACGLWGLLLEIKRHWN